MMAHDRLPTRWARLLAVLSLAAIAAPLTARDDGRVDQNVTPVIAWPIRLGLRARAVDEAFPLIDRVVLVPDDLTYLHELSRWSPRGRWPVLYEDDQLAPMFIGAFEPAQVIRRPAVTTGAPADLTRRQLIERIVISAWGGGASQSLAETFRRHDYAPPGAVIASGEDPAWTAAIALAAGRGQPIAWMEEDFGSPDDRLGADRAEELINRIESLLAETGWSYDELGDDIDAITICRAVAGRIDLALPADAQPVFAADSPPPREPGPPYAVTDVLGRHRDGRRWAIAGWIFGDEKRCAYMAMCSLFLARASIAFYHTYPDSDPWRGYDPSDAAAAARAKGYAARVVSGASTSELAWQRLLGGGIDGGVIVMHSKGGADYFDLFDGVRAHSQDVPILNAPAVVHLVHSWSAQAPADRETIAGRWLERGAYAYVGSVHEPYLSAFIPPGVLVNRLVNYAPFLVAARQHDPHPLAVPWKINTIGDPLMLIAPPEDGVKERLERAAGNGMDLRKRAMSLLRDLAGGSDGRAASEAIKALILLGRDEMAAQLWPLAPRGKAGAEAARAALGPLFRLKRHEAFIEAWGMLDAPTGTEKDMLWHLIGPRIRAIDDEQTLMLLQRAVRGPLVHLDLERLLPAVESAFGREHAIELLQRHRAQATNEHVRERLEAMLRRQGVVVEKED